jgi:hypothetical protein
VPIRRPRGPKPALDHIAFLDALAANAVTADASAALRAGFLTLRLFDAWLVRGSEAVRAGAQPLTATRAAVFAITADGEMRDVLVRIIDAMVMLQDADAQPVLPRLVNFATLLETRGHATLATDVYRVVTRHVDVRTQFPLAFDATMRLAAGYGELGLDDLAARSYDQAAMFAGRARDRDRVQLARDGGAAA